MTLLAEGPGRLIRPYTPGTNCKAERFIETSLRELPTPGPTSLQPSATGQSAHGPKPTTPRPHAGLTPHQRLNTPLGYDV